jgi:hypothetical protein
VRLYRRADLETELRRIGFSTKIFRRYGTMTLRPGTVGIQAIKPADGE